MLVEHSIITTRSESDVLMDVARLLNNMGFAIMPSPRDPAGPQVLEAQRGKRNAHVRTRISQLPQRIRLAFDRGRLSLAASLEVRHREYPEHATLLMAIAEMVQRRIDGTVPEQELLQAWQEANRVVNRRGRCGRLFSRVMIGMLLALLVAVVVGLTLSKR